MERKTVLVIGAHMDDCEIGAGGLIIKAVKRGHRVVLVNVASDYSTWIVTKGREEEIRRRVSKKAEEMGVEKRFVGYGYQAVPMDIEATKRLAEVVLDVRPDLTLFHNRYDASPSDHGTVGYIAEHAVRDATRLLDRYVSFSQEMYAFEIYPRISQFQPDVFIDISDVIDKVAQLPNYFDQIYAGYPPDRKTPAGPRAKVWLDYHEEEIPLYTHGDMKLVTAGFRGWQCGVRYAEAYMCLDKGVVGKRLLPKIVE